MGKDEVNTVDGELKEAVGSLISKLPPEELGKAAAGISLSSRQKLVVSGLLGLLAGASTGAIGYRAFCGKPKESGAGGDNGALIEERLATPHAPELVEHLKTPCVPEKPDKPRALKGILKKDGDKKKPLAPRKVTFNPIVEGIEFDKDEPLNSWH